MLELRGVIHGRTIELSGDLGITDGHEVIVTIRRIVGHAALVAAVHSTAGCMADDPEFDRITSKIEADRREVQHRGPFGRGWNDGTLPERT